MRTWTDIAIETSHIKYGHSSSSVLAGQEMKPERMKTWPWSLNACYEKVAGLESMEDKDATDNKLHKEESKSQR